MSSIKPYTLTQLVAIVRHSYGYQKDLNTVKFLVDRVRKLAPWGFPLGVLGESPCLICCEYE